MSSRSLAVVTLAILVAASGCSGNAPGPAAATSPFEALEMVGPDAGAIDGRVVDDELQPVPGADVGVVRGAQPTRTDAEGAFRIGGLTPGVHEIAVQAIGFHAAVRPVEVTAGETTPLTFPLAPVEFVGAYDHTSVFEGHIKAGGLLLDILLDPSTGLPAGCVSCWLNFTTTDDVEEVLFELSFKATLANPRGQTFLQYQLWDLDGEGGLQNNYATDMWMSGEKRSLNRVETMPNGEGPMPKHGARYQLVSYCDTLFVCDDQRFHIYYTQFHNGRAPPGFTALDS